MNKRRFLILYFSIIVQLIANAQVQVCLEPRHKNVLENKYLRLLDVHISPRDTTMFHIHSTPSFFLILSNTKVGVQIKGQEWTTSQNVAGESWYQSFLEEKLIHRVTNCDTLPFHVTDLEILAPYNNDRKIEPLPFDLLLENEKVLAYRVNYTSINNRVIRNRGPMIAQLVEGEKILVNDVKTKETRTINKGSYIYIEPESSFYFSAAENEKTNLVLLEIK